MERRQNGCDDILYTVILADKAEIDVEILYKRNIAQK